jgi:hypothetical protein
MNTKKIILIATITIVVLLAAWFVYGMFQGDDSIDINLDNQENNNVVNEEGRISDSDTRRGEIDRKNDNYKQAVASGEHNNCMNLEDQDMRNGCITSIAVKSSNLDLCQEIDDAEKLSYCKSRVYHKIAIENNNINNCSLIEDSFWSKSCLNTIVDNNNFEKSLCDEINDFEDAKACENRVSFHEAIETNNCNLLEGGMKEECESALDINQNKQKEEDGVEEETANSDEELRNMDSDGDGLSDYDEVNTYGTDPNNSDTDGDGYLDGEEVENGFDPLSA